MGDSDVVIRTAGRLCGIEGCGMPVALRTKLFCEEHAHALGNTDDLIAKVESREREILSVLRGGWKMVPDDSTVVQDIMTILRFSGAPMTVGRVASATDLRVVAVRHYLRALSRRRVIRIVRSDRSEIGDLVEVLGGR